MDVLVSLGDVWVPASCEKEEDGLCVCVVKYSELAASLDLVSVNLRLPLERVRFTELLSPPMKVIENTTNELRDDSKRLTEPCEPDLDVAVDLSDEEPPIEVIENTTNELREDSKRLIEQSEPDLDVTVDLSDEESTAGDDHGLHPSMRSTTSDFVLDCEFNENAIPQLFDLTPNSMFDRNPCLNKDQVLIYKTRKTKSGLPYGTFTFTDLMYTVRTCLRNWLDVEEIENMIRLEFLELDEIFFDTTRSNLGFHPLLLGKNGFAYAFACSIIDWEYWMVNGVKVYKNTLGNPRRRSFESHSMFPATFDPTTNMVTIVGDTYAIDKLPFCLVSTGEDYLVHVYNDIKEPIDFHQLVNWRDVPEQMDLCLNQGHE